MSIRFSVVIPTSHNRGKQLLLTLASFENQTYPKDKFEVIVVDDCSTDDTSELVKNYKAPYELIFLSTASWKGASAARNLGIQHARGKYIIFCDCDFLVVPRFIELHNQYHLNHKRSIVTGFPQCLKKIYTAYYPSFTRWEQDMIHSTLKDTKYWNDSYLSSDNVSQIITQKDIRENFSKVYDVLCPLQDYSKEQIRELVKTDAVPWLLFVTRCVSVRKKYLVDVGGFDERLNRFEDGEIGYRLHKKLGLSFIRIKQEIGFHQEHPSSFRDRNSTSGESYLKILYEKNGTEDPELTLLSIWKVWNGDVKIYKNTLRTLMKGERKSQMHKDFNASLKEASRLCALKQLHQNL